MNTLTDVAKEILTRLERIERKLDDLYEEDESSFDDYVDQDTIYKKGRRVPYNRITNPREVKLFKDFVNHIVMNYKGFTPKEVEYAGYAADKDFIDVRLADNSRRILGAAYQRIHGREWAINFIRGHMIKYNGQIAWQWSDGSRD